MGSRALRVLWFTAALPEAARSHLGLPSAGGPLSWLDGMSTGLAGRSEIELAIASPSPIGFEPFENGGIIYFPLPDPRLSGWTPLLQGGWTGGENSAGVLAAGRGIIEFWQPAVVHVHGTETPLGLLAGHSRTPSLISMQGVLAGCAPAFFKGVTPRDAAALVSSRSFFRASGEIHGYLRLRRMVPRERLMLQRCRHIEGRTAFDEAYVRAVNPTASYHHCDEIMRPAFYGPQWRDSSIAGKASVIFTTSSAMLFKGTETLFAATSVLLRRYGRRVILRVAGAPASGEVGRFLRRRAIRSGVWSCVRWLERLDADALANEIRSCDVYAYPSHMDNSPNSLVEALLLGAPCVAARTGGIPSLIASGETGLLCTPGDAFDFALELQRLLVDRPLARELGRRARGHSLARHDPDAVVARQMAIYEHVRDA